MINHSYLRLMLESESTRGNEIRDATGCPLFPPSISTVAKGPVPMKSILGS